MPEKKSVKQEVKKEAVIYLGPAIPGVAVHGTVYCNGLATQLQAAIQEEPAINMLLVPIRAAAKIKKELKRGSSAANVCYERAVKYAEKKGVKR